MKLKFFFNPHDLEWKNMSIKKPLVEIEAKSLSIGV